MIILVTVRHASLLWSLATSVDIKEGKEKTPYILVCYSSETIMSLCEEKYMRLSNVLQLDAPPSLHTHTHAHTLPVVGIIYIFIHHAAIRLL